MILLKIEIALEALIYSLTIRRIIFLLGLMVFCLWAWSDILLALEHVVLSARTEDDHKLAVHALERMSVTLLPFGRFSSKLMFVSFFGVTVFWLINLLELQSLDWDRNIKDLKAKRKTKIKKLKAEIERLELLSAKAAIISDAVKDIEILADKVERLKLELDNPRKPLEVKPTPQVNKTADLFIHKLRDKQGPPKLTSQERPEF